MRISDTVRIIGTGAHGKITETRNGQHCVTLPSGTWGWHWPNELEPADFDFDAAQARFRRDVERERRRTCRAFTHGE